MPDIDMDFSVDRREEVIDYVAHKYGRDRVAQIITFGTMAARAAVRDAARVMGMPYAVGDKIAKMIPEQAPPATFKQAMLPGGELKQAYEADAQVKEVVDLAMSLEGLIRNDSIHAAAVVISDQPLTEYLPLQQKGDAELVTQFDMNDVAKLGLLKMDFLGLRNLDVIEAALEIIEKTDGVCIEIDQLPLDDEKTYKMLRARRLDGRVPVREPGHARGAARRRPHAVRGPHRHRRSLPPGAHAVHPHVRAQQEGPGLGRLRPRGPAPHPGAHARRDHLPGAVHGHRPPGGRVQRRRRPTTCARPSARRTAELMATLKEPLMQGLAASGVPPAVANKLWASFEATGDYSFNKSHAACYALISYRTAWLKANYPVEYMAALISSVMNTKDKVPFYVNQCHELGIEVLPPDVNESDVGFTVVDGKIRFGLNAVKGVGRGAIEAIIAARAARPFTSIYDFCARVDSQMANKRTLEALIHSGAFDSTGDPRRGMLEALPAAMADGERRRKDAAQGQGGLFDVMAPDESRPTGRRCRSGEFDQATLLKAEKEALGLYVSSHPLQGLREQLRDEIEVAGRRARRRRRRQPCCGPAASSPTPRRRSARTAACGSPSASRTSTAAWSAAPGRRPTSSTGTCWSRTAIVKVKGRVERKPEGETMLIAIEVLPFSGVSEYRPLTVTIDARRAAAAGARRPARILADFPGHVPVVLHMVRDERARPPARRRRSAGGAGGRALRRAQGAARRELHRGRLRPAASVEGRRDDPRGHARRAAARGRRRCAPSRRALPALRGLRLRRGAHALARVRRDARGGRRTTRWRPATGSTTRRAAQLMVRTDMTVPVARLAATRYRDKPLPLRFCYVAPSIRPWAPQRSQDGEFVQAGAELLGAALGGRRRGVRRRCSATRWRRWACASFRVALGTVAFYARARRLARPRPTTTAEKLLEALADRDYPLLESIAGNADVDDDALQGAAAHARAQRHARQPRAGAQAGEQRRPWRPPSSISSRCATSSDEAGFGDVDHLRLRALPGPHLLQRRHLRGLRAGRRPADRLRRPLRRAAGALRLGHPRGRLRHRRRPRSRRRSKRPAPRPRPRRPVARRSSAASTSRRGPRSCAAPAGRWRRRPQDADTAPPSAAAPRAAARYTPRARRRRAASPEAGVTVLRALEGGVRLGLACDGGPPPAELIELLDAAGLPGTPLAGADPPALVAAGDDRWLLAPGADVLAACAARRRRRGGRGQGAAARARAGALRAARPALRRDRLVYAVAGREPAGGRGRASPPAYPRLTRRALRRLRPAGRAAVASAQPPPRARLGLADGVVELESRLPRRPRLRGAGGGGALQPAPGRGACGAQPAGRAPGGAHGRGCARPWRRA